LHIWPTVKPIALEIFKNTIILTVLHRYTGLGFCLDTNSGNVGGAWPHRQLGASGIVTKQNVSPVFTLCGLTTLNTRIRIKHIEDVH